MIEQLIEAAHVPPGVLRPQSFGLWHIEVHDLTRPPWNFHRKKVGFDTWTVLRHHTEATMHLARSHWAIVMEDSRKELTKHTPIFMRASGRVLVTGLGLGCVVRGLLAKPSVDHIDVVELDRQIIKIIGTEFAGNPRVTMHHGDALKIELPGRWDYAWHDLWCEEDRLQLLHAELFAKFAHQCGWQGAWQFPGNLARMLPWNNERRGRHGGLDTLGNDVTAEPGHRACVTQRMLAGLTNSEVPS